MKIVFFGDSLTQGTYGVNYVEKVARAFPQHECLNAGVNGDTSLNLYRRVQDDVINKKPDGVFVMVGINDAVSYTEAGIRPYYRLAKGVRGGQVAPIAFRENMRAVLGKLAQSQLRIWVALPPIEYRAEVIAALRTINGMTRELCEEMNVPVLDVMEALVPAAIPVRPPMGLMSYRRNLMANLVGARVYDKLQAEGQYSYSFDGIHLTERGATQIAELIVPFLSQTGLG
ncbi:MAG: hypothetical protein J0L63_17555 [Anaerolineae bacterium]|nr:hypothetical protein [Anaerolineae bacterium]MBN8620725.1 hypothetical protein [Anaerolineae bacterium]